MVVLPEPGGGSGGAEPRLGLSVPARSHLRPGHLGPLLCRGQELPQKEKNAFTLFWRAFRENLKQGIRATLICVPVLLLLIFGYSVMKANWGSDFGAVMFVAYDIALVVPLGVMVWLFPLLGRFDAPLKDSLRTAAMLTFRHLPSTVILVLLTVETAVSLIEKWWPVFFAPALWALLCSLFMERIFPKYLTESEIEQMNTTSETPVSEE